MLCRGYIKRLSKHTKHKLQSGSTMTALIKTLLLLGAIVLATAEPLAVMETKEEEIAISQAG